MLRRVLRARVVVPALVVIALAGAPASATWSIILIDTRTGEVAMGSATCLANFNLRDNTPVLVPGVGAATAQSFVDSTGQNRVLIRDRLAQGVSPAEILTQLATFDSGHQTRQYGMADTRGGTLTFSGTGAGAWAGGRTGEFVSTHGGNTSTIVYAIQGNVLTGPAVVDQAVSAAINTQGDLAAKLMASMQAARAMGGDGRCSCSAGNPTGCGAPPPSFTKSAHIAYMMIARAGDREGGNGIYRAVTAPLAVAASDVTGDGRPDLLVANTSGNSISLLTNTTPSAQALPFTGPLLSTFGPLPTNVPTSSGPRDLVVADVSGDSIPDVVTADANSSMVTVCRGLGGGAFAAPASYAVGLSPRSVAVAELNGQPGLDIAVANTSAASVSVLLNDGTGAFPGFPTTVAVESTPVDLVAAALVGAAAGPLDLAVVCRGTNRVVVLTGDGTGGFGSPLSVPTLTGPTSVAAADLDGDGDVDLAVGADTAASVQVLKNDGTGASFAPTTYTAGAAVSDILIGDVNGAGGPDLVATGGSRFAVFFNSGPGSPGVFTLNRTYTVAGTIVGGALRDLDGDGDLDLAAASSTLAAAITVRNYGPGALAGTFNDGLGTGTGDYYMNFNIAFQSAAAPDPVAQLQGAYDLWRFNLGGHADAVRSQVTISPPYLPADGTATATLTITPRDVQGNQVTLTAGMVEVVHAPASAGRCVIGTPVVGAGGTVTVPLTAGSGTGLDRFQITVRDPTRAVVLMPDPQLALHVAGCYANCDQSTAPPALSVQDFTCFLAQFVGGSPYANCDQSTATPALNFADFGCFLRKYAGGCP